MMRLSIRLSSFYWRELISFIVGSMIEALLLKGCERSHICPAQPSAMDISSAVVTMATGISSVS
jgi:hypothetical protein